MPLLQIEQLRTWFPVYGGVLKRPVSHVKAVDNVSLTIDIGKVLGLVGESGSGKTTLGRSILRLIEPSGGSIIFDGVEIRKLSRLDLRRFRRRMQIVFQDPFSSLNPRLRIGDMIGEAIDVHGLAKNRAKRDARIEEILNLVGLSSEYAERYPHEFSGGQRQRLGIARALAVQPEFIVADEPVSALDVSIQAQIINLLNDLKQRLGLTILFISHDLAVVRNICDDVAVMYLGRVVEIASSSTLFSTPRHPYTAALLSAAPVPDPELRHQRVVLTGDIPSPINPPSGCVFRTRCPYATDACSKLVPKLLEVGPGHYKACIRDDIVLPSRIFSGFETPTKGGRLRI